jgi:hypothetical protein
MEYQYYSATNYQEDFVDTDFLAAFRKAGAKLFKILVNAILTATGIGNILKIPPLSFIADMLLEFISTMLMDGLLGPIRKFVETDTQYDRTNNGLVDADATSTLHVGDPGGLFGLDTAWEPGGYALAYRDDDAYNVQALNSVTVYTNRKKVGSLWDGRGVLAETEWKGTTFQSTGSRIHNVGYATNPPLNLSTFRFNTQDRFSNGDTGKMDFDSSTGPNEKPHSVPGTYDRQDDYWMTAATKLGDQIKTGSRKLNPSFGGGIRLTDLDTNLDDIFFYGSAAFLPDHGFPTGGTFGDTNYITLSGANWQAHNAGWSETGAEYTAAQPPEIPAPPTTNNPNGYTYGKMGKVTFDGSSPTTDAYVFNAVDDGGAGISGLKVTYRGPDTLTGPANAQPTNITEARKPENYRVTNMNGNTITAELLVDEDQIRINHGAKPAAVLATDWIMANSTNDKKLRTPVAGDVDFASPDTDDKTTDWGRLDLGLGARLEPLLPQTVNPRRDDDLTTGWNPKSGANDKEGYNFTSVQLATPAVINYLNNPAYYPLGAPAAPNAGGSWQPVNSAAIATTNLGALPWTNWTFVSGSDKDFNGDGTMSGGALNAGQPQSIEAANATKEAAIAWNRLIDQQVPASFYKKETYDSYINNLPGNPATDEWNLHYAPWDPNTGSSGNYQPIAYNGGTGVNGAPAANKYFWQDGAGNQYIAVWSNMDTNADGIPDQRDGATGLPRLVPPATASKPIAVYRYTKGGTIQVCSTNDAALAAEPKPILNHRETAIMVIDDDSSLGANSKLLRTLADLKARGYSQGRNNDDTTGAAYTLGGTFVPTYPLGSAGEPPPGTPGDFNIMNYDAGKTVTLAFTRPYGGIVDVPPSQDAAGNPREDWTAVNGWTVKTTIDGNSGTNGYAPGQQKIWLDESVPGTTDNVWAIQDYSHPGAGTAYTTHGGGGGWTGNGFDTTWGAMWGGPDGGGRDEVSLGTKFNITNIGAGPHFVQIRADDGAAVFVNGKYQGQCSGYTAWSNIAINPADLRPGENIVTIQAIDRGGPGGVECQVVVNGAQQVTSGNPAAWKVLNSPAVSTPDEMVLTKSFTLTSPNGSTLGSAAADGIFTGDLLPGEFVDLSFSGVNTGAPQLTGMDSPQTIDTGWFPFNTDAYVSMIPDRASLKITNAKGTFTLPLSQYDSGSDQWVKKDEGSGTFHIPSDYLAAGGNTIELNVERGGIVQQFCRNEPPSSPPAGWLYRNLAQGQVQAAGYWINTSNLLDDDGSTVLVPAGSLLYGGKVVSQAGFGNSFSYGPNGIIYNNGQAAKPEWYGFRPDSYFDRTGTTIDNQPIFAGLPGFSPNRGYQLKKDIRTGMSMGNKDTSQELHTFATKSFDRYVFDPNTQTIMDVMAANQNGLEGTSATAPGGSETQDVPFTGSGDRVNVKKPLMLNANGTVLQNNGVPDPTGREILPGSTGIGQAPVGIRIKKQDRQTFGSDDNELTRTLYGAMKPIDLDGVNEDLNGNGILDAGEDGNGNGILDNGTLEADARAYKEYRDCFNYGLLDHIYISGTAYSPTGGGFSSVMEFNWKNTDIKDKTSDHVTKLGTVIQNTSTKTQANSYMNNYEYFANETDRRNKKYTVVRRGDMLMNSFYSFRKEV